MPTVRCEVREFGAAENREAILVPTIKRMGASSETVPTSTSQIVFGPVTAPTNVVVKAIGSAIYARSGAYVASPIAPVAGAAPVAGEYIAAGGYAIIELAAGDAIAAMLASLS